ncbi:MAG: PH domain-containing protein [Chloroflexi bacterium]|nr:PH domain-containing protein [Chloroflexota bacterium]
MNNKPNYNEELITLAPSFVYAFACVFPWLLAAVICFAFAFLFLKLLSVPSLLFELVALCKYLQIVHIRYTLCQEVLIVRKGIIARRYDHLELFRVKDYVIHQSAYLRYFRLMSVSLYTTDLTINVLVLEGIPVSGIGRMIRDLAQQARVKNRIFEIN